MIFRRKRVVPKTTKHETPPLNADVSKPSSPVAGKKHHRLRWFFIGGGVVVAAILAAGIWLVYHAIAVINTQKINGNRVGIIQQLTHIVSASDEKLQGENDDRINIVLMGIGGEGHDGPYLTDTLMVASFKPSTKQISMISIPRDLVVDLPKYGYRKINMALYVGREQKYPGGGEALVMKVVSDLLDIPIHYYARIDFQGFADIVDRVGGVTVTVDNSFTDYSYPTENYGYQTVRFTTGEQKMNGATALKFARSRHGNNGEGSDFARAKRQQKIIVALKEKILSVGTLLNPSKISDILSAVGSHSQTNMEVWEMIRLANLVKEADTGKIINKVIQNGTDGLVKSATGIGGAYILVPVAGNYGDIQFMAKNIFDIAAAENETKSLMLVNASGKSTVINNAYNGLSAFGLNVVRTKTYATKLEETVLIDNTGGQSAATVNILRSYNRFTKVLSPSEWTEATGDTTLLKYFASSTNTNSSKNVPDLILVLGKDQIANKTTLDIPTTSSSTTKKTTNTNTNKNTNSSKTTTKNTNSAVNTNTAVNTNSAVNTNTSTNTNTAP